MPQIRCLLAHLAGPTRALRIGSGRATPRARQFLALRAAPVRAPNALARTVPLATRRPTTARRHPSNRRCPALPGRLPPLRHVPAGSIRYHRTLFPLGSGPHRHRIPALDDPHHADPCPASPRRDDSRSARRGHRVFGRGSLREGCPDQPACPRLCLGARCDDHGPTGSTRPPLSSAPGHHRSHWVLASRAPPGVAPVRAHAATRVFAKPGSQHSSSFCASATDRSRHWECELCYTYDTAPSAVIVGASQLHSAAGVHRPPRLPYLMRHDRLLCELLSATWSVGCVGGRLGTIFLCQAAAATGRPRTRQTRQVTG